jgi:uncharacterized protein
MCRALLAGVYQAASTACSDKATDPAGASSGAAVENLDAAWNLLTRIDQVSPQILADVLRHPYVRVWAVRCLEQLRASPGKRARLARISGDRSLAADLGHLGAIAAAAAIRSGLDARVFVPVLNGAVHLPTLGRLVVGPAVPPPEPGPGHAPARRMPCPELAAVTAEAELVTVRTQDGAWQLTRPDLLTRQAGSRHDEPAGWQPVRRLTAPGISVMLEDTDPYRGCHQWAAAQRLSGAEVAAWQRAFGRAWAQIQREHSAYAPGLASGLRTVTPLSSVPAGHDVSATARQAFGAVAIALPADHSILALLLIHEFQHVKLSAVLDLYDLYDAADTRLFPAPWRDDLRPLEGLLQGTYAHVAVTDFWRVHRNAAAGPAAELAESRFAHWRVRTADAIESLAASGSLTPLGERFIDGMRSTIAPMLDEPVLLAGTDH